MSKTDAKSVAYSAAGDFPTEWMAEMTKPIAGKTPQMHGA